jgi:hypothetical protein
MPDSTQQNRTEAAPLDLVSLVRGCYPDLPGSAAVALATSSSLGEVAALGEAFNSLYRSRHFHADFVFVILCELVLRIVTILYQTQQDQPALKKALEQSGAGWIFEYLKENNHEQRNL